MTLVIPNKTYRNYTEKYITALRIREKMLNSSLQEKIEPTTLNRQQATRYNKYIGCNRMAQTATSTNYVKNSDKIHDVYINRVYDLKAKRVYR